MPGESIGIWNGMLAGFRTDLCDISVEAVLRAMSDDRGGSRPFLAAATDGERYWVKQVQNPASPRVPVTEQVISGCGRLIGAPVRACRLIMIPEELDGELLSNGTVLHQGIAHGSLNLEYSAFDKTWGPENRTRDDNRRRHAAYFAFFDWCWGDDRQWLYDTIDDMTTYSHDHGHFLPGGPNWTTESLLNHQEQAHSLDSSPEGLDYNELERVADKSEGLTAAELKTVLCGIPASWPVANEELEVLGYFLDSRRLPSARRIRQLAATIAR